MASSFTGLGTELMTTGENAGTWGTTTNTNLQIIEQIAGGYIEQDIAGSADTTTLAVSDGSAGAVLAHRIIKFTGTITGNQIVTIPLDVQQMYVLVNGTSGAYTVQFKYASGSGSSVTFAATDKGTKLVYATADHATNPNLVDTGIASTGDHDLDGNELILDADADTSITADTDDQIDIKIAGADDFQFTANTFTAQAGSTIVGPTITASTAFVPDASDGASLGTSSLEFSDLFLADGAVINFGDDQEIKLTHVADTGLTLKHTATADDKPVSLTLQTGETDIAANDIIGKIDFQAPDEGTGTDAILVAAGIEAVSEGDFSSSSNATKLSFKTGASEAASEKMSLSSGGNLTISGDLTVSGDDITMGTNTAGNLLIADGTNFNSIAVGSLSEISTVANDDVFLAVDTSGGGLKKITRSTLTAGIVTGSEISNVVEDTSPQLGGDLDTNSFNITIDDAHFIKDENGNEQIIFQTTSSAVNQFDITNAATGNPPKISATGGDSNIDLDLEAKGTGHVTVRGNDNPGAIQFNCESNSHGQILKSQPHSAAVTNVMLLPDGADSTLVSLVATQTLTNKTLTTPVIAEIDSGSTITLDATTDIVLDADGGDVFFKDAGTTIATFTNSSTDFIIETATSDKDLIFKVNDGGSSTEVARFDGDVSAFKVASGKKIMLGAAEESISGDGTDITFAVGSSGDINIPANIGLTFGDDGEKIEGDGTDLTIAGNNINLTAVADVVIPNNVGIQFGGASEKIEGDGTDLTISANNLTVDAAADINLDADGADVNIKDGGTTILSFTNSSSDAVITAGVQDKDIIFKGDDGGSAVTSLTLDMSAGGIATFSAAANVAQGALTSSSNAVAWDASAKPNAVHVTTENTTFSAPSNAVEGAFICIEINYNGSHSIGWNTVFEFAASTEATETATDGKTDIHVFRYNGAVWQEVGRTLNLAES